MPFAVGPCLNPSMVVVGMCPAWCIDLAGGNTDGTQGGDSKGGFLSTTADGCVHAGQRRQRARIAGLIGHVFMTPVVDLEDCLFHAHAGNAFFQLVEEYRAGHIQRLVIDAQWQHKMVEKQIRNLFAPGHLFSGFEGGPHVLKVELYRVVRHIGQWHVGI